MNDQSFSEPSSALVASLKAFLPPERIKARPIDRYAYASDASHFYLVPQVVVQPASEQEIVQLFKVAVHTKLSLTFRTAGTSLSGQAVTSGILADLSRFWRKVDIHEHGHLITLEPGVIGGDANARLKKFGRKIGPDPASINSAMLGGILSNNSSGMCCGVKHNAYHTLTALRFILPDGTTYDTADPADYDRFRQQSPHLAAGLLQLRQEILGDAQLTARIRHKYRQKNTTGYSLNAFLDYEHPLDILAHLLIGSEGTLAFLARASLSTIPDHPCKRTGLLYFSDPVQACQAIPALRDSGAEALEFMDRASLRSVEKMPGVPPRLASLGPDAAAILCEYQAVDVQALDHLFNLARPVLERLSILSDGISLDELFTTDEAQQAIYWKIRKGLYPTVAGIRAKGTATMLEDITFPVERLGEAIPDVQDLFRKYHYTDGIIFGHAKDGNLHFCISQDFALPDEVRRFADFNDELFYLVIQKYDGSLKGEHGTGRAVAPYVEAEWGPEAYAIMQQLKQLIDPQRLLNPGVLLPEDKNVHLRDLKVLPGVEEEVDKCVECGFCERRCPSRDYTLTPRQRIGIRRALKRLEQQGEHQTYQHILHDYQHAGMDTCAVDGMCATDCPVHINTGELIKRLRRENHSAWQNNLALTISKNFKLTLAMITTLLRLGHGLGKLAGPSFMPGLTGFIRRLWPGFPLWLRTMPPPWRRPEASTHSRSDLSVVYFTTCINRMMGGDLPRQFVEVSRRAGVHAVIPDDLTGYCCGQLFSSKGFTGAFRDSINRLIPKLFIWSRQGHWPIVLDVTSCTQTLQNAAPYLTPDNLALYQQLQIMDSLEFTADVLLPRLKITKPKEKIVFHPVCSAYKMGLVNKLQVLGQACAVRAEIPLMAGCCGMAGDRGFYYPQLTQAATAKEAQEVSQTSYDGYYSSATTCEMNMSAAVGQNYHSVLKLLLDVTA